MTFIIALFFYTMALTIDDIKKIFIPKNSRLTRNNAAEVTGALYMPNDAVSLYDAITTVNPPSGISDGDKGDIIVSSSGSLWKLDSFSATIGQTLVWNGTSWVASNPPGVTDGNKGHITVSLGGTSWTLNSLGLAANQILQWNGSSWVGTLPYAHPNHSGDVSSLSDGLTTINTDTVTNQKLSNMPANTVKVRNSSSAGDPVDLTLPINTILGRGSSDITPLTLGTNISISGSTLNVTAPSSSINVSQINPTSGSGKAIAKYYGPAPTWTRTSPSIWTINVPSGCELKSFVIYSPSAANPGSNVTVIINTASSIYNQDITTANLPLVWGAAINGSTGNYALTTGTPNLNITISSAPVNGDLQLLINNYNAASACGTSDSSLIMIF